MQITWQVTGYPLNYTHPHNLVSAAILKLIDCRLSQMCIGMAVYQDCRWLYKTSFARNFRTWVLRYLDLQVSRTF